MKLSCSCLALSIISIYAQFTSSLTIPLTGIQILGLTSAPVLDPPTLYNRHRDVVIQEPIEKAQRRADYFAKLDAKEAKEAEDAAVAAMVGSLSEDPSAKTGLRKRSISDEPDAQIPLKKSPHHPKYRPTGTLAPPLETGTWAALALAKRRMEQRSAEINVESLKARSA